MNIIFNSAISNVRVYSKIENYDISYEVKKNFKVVVGRKFLIIPIFKTIPNAVVNHWNNKFICSVEDFKGVKSFIEDDTIYYKPHCKIFFGNGSQEIFFETIEELDKYVNDLKIFAPHIVIE
jgi:hypothetical protein